MLGTTFLLLRTFSFFGTHDSTLSQFSTNLTDYPILLPLPNLLPPRATEMGPRFCLQPSLLPLLSLLPWSNLLPWLPCLCLQPWPLTALNVLFQFKQDSSTRMIHSKCQMYQTHHHTSYPQFVHHPVIHSYTHTHTHTHTHSLVNIYHGARH